MFVDVKVLDEGQAPRRLALNRSQLRRLTLREPSAIAIHRRPTAGRRAVEGFLEEAYAVAFGGRVAAHYPVLMSLHDAAGGILAAAGFRLAATGPLFLEQYLDRPIEALMRDAPPRAAIAEIGNLASGGSGASVVLIAAIADQLRREGCSHAAVTATAQLRRGFSWLGFDYDQLAAADPSRLADGGASWGRYYEADPRVIAGSLDVAASLPGRLIAAPAGPMFGVCGPAGVECAA